MDAEWNEWLNLRERLALASAKFLEAVLKLDPDKREEAGACGRWSAKEIVSHIAGWEWEVSLRFRMFLAAPVGDIPYDVDSFNERAVASRRHLTWEQVTAELETAQKDLGSVYGKIGADDLVDDNRFRQWTEILIRHYEHHLAYIEQLR